MWLERTRDVEVKRIRMDSGREYIENEFKNTCSELGIIHGMTSPYTPEHNRVIERYNNMLQEGALTLQHDANLTSRFWVLAVHTINFIRNQILQKINKSA